MPSAAISNAEDFRLMKDVFEHVDENKDGTLSKKEFPRLNDIPAHVRLGGVVRSGD